MYYKILDPPRAGAAEGTVGESCHGGVHTWALDQKYGPVPVNICSSGFHACRLEDLSNWLRVGCLVFEVDLEGVETGDNKVVGSSATLTKFLGRMPDDGWRKFAKNCADRAAGYAKAADPIANPDAVWDLPDDPAEAAREERRRCGRDILSLLVP